MTGVDDFADRRDVSPSVPSISIVLAFERAPSIVLDAPNESEWIRLRDWLAVHPEIGALYDCALDVLIAWQAKAA
jgi:hypothetical protein